MKNERGLTLVEVLATLTISTILLGVVALLLANTSLQSRTNAQKIQTDAEIRRTMDTLAKEFFDSSAAYVTFNEFRYDIFVNGDKQHRALVFNEAQKTLTLYKYLADISTNGSLATSPELYKKLYDLSTHLTAVQYLTSANATIANNTALAGGTTFRVAYTFQFQQPKLFGGTNNYNVVKQTGFKLLLY